MDNKYHLTETDKIILDLDQRLDLFEEIVEKRNLSPGSIEYQNEFDKALKNSLLAESVKDKTHDEIWEEYDTDPGIIKLREEIEICRANKRNRK